MNRRLNSNTFTTSFSDLNVEIPSGSDGEIRVLCPQCAEHHRTKSKTLGVNVREGIFHCFRCGWKGRTGHEYRNVIPLAPRRRKRDTDRKARAIEAVLSSAITLSDPRAEIGRNYLRERLGYVLAEPPRLGFHAGLAFYDTDNGGQRVGQFPALIGRVVNVGGNTVTVHRTYLAKDGSGKASVTSPKKLMSPARGTVTGCAVRLYQAEGELVVAEGIETALALAYALELPAWAAISAHGLATIELPRSIHRVTVGADNDRSGTGQDAALVCRKKLEREGRKVRVMFPKRQGLDWADVLKDGYA